MGVEKIIVRDNYGLILKEIKGSVTLIKSDIDKVKADLVEIKNNTKKE